MIIRTTPITAYNNLVNSGGIRTDPHQAYAMERLQKLDESLEVSAQRSNWTGWRSKLNFLGYIKDQPRGIYMWGGVGRGKSMLMELFFNHTNVHERKHVHFHAFMQEIHSQIHAHQAALDDGSISMQKDPMSSLAKVVLDQAWLLCFDEFHVTDIGDAMILGRLFRALFNAGAVVVATSNRMPKDLYKDGLQRELFLPFINMIEEQMEIIELNGDTDYRLERIQDIGSYISPIDKYTPNKLNEHFSSLTVGAVPEPITIKVKGRQITFPHAAEGVVMTDFESLCEAPLGPADFLAITARFHTLIIDKIPILGPERRNEAKRFVILIDAMYEAKANLICAAAAQPEELYPEGDGAFEFQRTVSRIMEMRSPSYISKEHISSEDHVLDANPLSSLFIS